ncbi:MAG: hypothetical protein HYX66_03945 [Ignavibacteria bacterium]|nr:hypothetical protein [Ignavibacteria bacterium]
MVNRCRLIALLAAAVLLGACQGEKLVQEISSADSTTQISVADTASGKVLEGESLNDIRISLKIENGMKFRYRIKEWSDDVQDSMIISTFASHVYTKNGLAPRSDGALQFTMRIDTVAIDMKATHNSDKRILNETHFSSRDSANPSDPTRVIQMGPVGETVTVTIGSDGKIQEIGGVSLVFNKIAKKLPNAPASDQARMEAIRFLESALYGKFVGMEYLMFPKTNLDSTRSWTNSQLANLGPLFSAETTTTYRLVSVKVVKGRRIATIEADLTGAIRLNPPSPQMGVMAELQKSSVRGKSHAVIDLENGATIAKKNSISFSVKASVMDPTSRQKRTLTQSNETRYEIELLPN